MEEGGGAPRGCRFLSESLKTCTEFQFYMLIGSFAVFIGGNEESFGVFLGDNVYQCAPESTTCKGRQDWYWSPLLTKQTNKNKLNTYGTKLQTSVRVCQPEHAHLVLVCHVSLRSTDFHIVRVVLQCNTTAIIKYITTAAFV